MQYGLNEGYIQCINILGQEVVEMKEYLIMVQQADLECAAWFGFKEVFWVKHEYEVELVLNMLHVFLVKRNVNIVFV